MELATKRKVYFPNLNGLRFIAALFVIIHHIEQFKNLYGLENYWNNPFVLLVGKLGVVLFFVLSGFLITYLLLEEKSSTGTISIKQFYVRRILRIWPLYYLIVTIGLFVLPHVSFLNMGEWSNALYQGFGYKILLLLLFLPNLVLVKYFPIPYISQTWSVGVEEQFYLIWPILVKRSSNILKMLIGVIVFYLCTKFALIAINRSLFPVPTLLGFWNSFSIDCMAIGGLGAYILFNKNTNILSILFNKYIQCFVYLISIFLIIRGIVFTNFHYEVYAFLFIVIVLNLAGNPKSILNFENSVMNYLGKISYGLYMYHIIAIVIVIKLFNSLGISSNFVTYSSIIIITILIASISYELIEKQFIKRKVKYSRLLSGDFAKPNSENGSICD